MEQENRHGGDRYDRYKVAYRAQGKLRLEDDTAEALVKLLMDGVDVEDSISRLGISPEEYKAITAEPIFQARLDHLKSRPTEKCPTTQDEYFHCALRGLWKISQTTKDDSVKIKSLKELAIVASKAPDAKPQSKTSSELDELKDVFGGGSE